MGSQYTIPSIPVITVPSTALNKKITFALDTTGDLSFGDEGRSPYMVTGIDKIRQDVQFILRSLKGAYSFNPELGLDLFSISESEYDPLIIEHEVEHAILKHPDILEVKNLTIKSTSDYSQESDTIRHHYFVEFTVQCINNELFFTSVAL